MEPSGLTIEKASREVARSAYRTGGSSMRTAIAQAREAERRARKAVLQEQAAHATEKAELVRQKTSFYESRDEAAERLAAALAQYSATVALRCDHALPAAEALECREALECIKRAAAEHHHEESRAALEHDRACAALTQVTLDREVRLVRLASDESVAAAGMLTRQRVQRSKVTLRVMLAAMAWRTRAKAATLRTALREAVLRLKKAEGRVRDLEGSVHTLSLAASRDGGAHGMIGGGAPSSANNSLDKALRASERAKMTAQEALLASNIEAQQKAAEAEAATTTLRQTEHLLRETLNSAKAYAPSIYYPSPPIIEPRTPDQTPTPLSPAPPLPPLLAPPLHLTSPPRLAPSGGFLLASARARVCVN